MKYRKTISAITATIFLLVIMAGAYDRLSAQSAATDEISSLLKQADEAYQNGNFTLAIEKYQKVMELLNNKKELAKTKQALIQTMISLALTYFTIRENEKAQKQLEDLITLNPNYELDPEIYTPKFIDMFKNVQKNLLGKITIVTTPPGCIIFLNGSKMGQSPLTLERCLKGKYQLKAELKGYGGVAQDIEIKPGLENRQELTLETEHAVVEKKLGKPLPVLKKKKKWTPWLIAGGAAVVVVALILALHKKSTSQPQEKVLIQTNTTSVTIRTHRTSTSQLDVATNKTITRVEYQVVITHPNQTDLLVQLSKQGGSVTYTIWNNQSFSGTNTISGQTHVFDGMTSAGTWLVSVDNSGGQTGTIDQWTLKIYYLE